MENRKDKNKNILIVVVSLLLTLLLLFLLITINQSDKEKVLTDDLKSSTKVENVKDKKEVILEEDKKMVAVLEYKNDDSVLKNINDFMVNDKEKHIKDFINNDNFNLKATIETNKDIKEVSVKVYNVTKINKKMETIIQNINDNTTYTDEKIDIYNLPSNLISYVPISLFTDEVVNKEFKEEVVLDLVTNVDGERVYEKQYENDFNYYVSEGYERVGSSGDNTPIYIKGEYVFYGQIYELYIDGVKYDMPLQNKVIENQKFYNNENLYNTFVILNKIKEEVGSENNGHSLNRKIKY